MMHDMRDLQCLNVGITPGCYKYCELKAEYIALVHDKAKQEPSICDFTAG